MHYTQSTRFPPLPYPPYTIQHAMYHKPSNTLFNIILDPRGVTEGHSNLQITDHIYFQHRQRIFQTKNPWFGKQPTIPHYANSHTLLHNTIHHCAMHYTQSTRFPPLPYPPYTIQHAMYHKPSNTLFNIILDPRA
ncbi:hypothetical protein CDAR_177751 [Caerostris darwini]|uniref:Uncharacterized protein n=1 Tax=Caerostris darwini TaxID=1538125 RepID=A0AAV4RJS9_9ARAC|nr:hypothetical protein CDAR_177751 [Caerostris darwini]